jgi:hypothetical protein
MKKLHSSKNLKVVYEQHIKLSGSFIYNKSNARPLEFGLFAVLVVHFKCMTDFMHFIHKLMNSNQGIF